MASKLGRTYRIPRTSLDLLLWATRTRKDLTLREYTGEEIAEFIRADELDEETREIARQFSKATERQAARRSSERINQAGLPIRALSPGEFIRTVLPDHTDYPTAR